MHKTLIRDISEHSARVDFTTYLDNEVSSGERSCIFHWTRHRSSLCIFRLHFPCSPFFLFPFLFLSLFFNACTRRCIKIDLEKKMNFSSFMEENRWKRRRVKKTRQRFELVVHKYWGWRLKKFSFLVNLVRWLIESNRRSNEIFWMRI